MLAEGVERCPDTRAFRNDYAWALATAADPALRDGARALALAQEVARGPGGDDPTFLDTLAAAYAEAGDYDEAARAARRAVALLEARGAPDAELAAYRAHLATLRADRRALAAHPDAAWREEVGTVLDKRLLRAEQEVRSEATQAAHSALVEIQRELSSLRREVDQLRRTHE